MADLDEVTTEEMIFELRERADSLVLWYGKDGEDDFWTCLKGPVDLIEGVGECCAETAVELSLLGEDALVDMDGTAIFKEKMLKRFK